MTDNAMNKDRKHVALFVFGLSGGGVPKMMLNLSHALAERGHRVDLLAIQAHGPLYSQVSARVRLVPLGDWKTRLPWIGRKRKRRIVAALPALIRYLRRERPDVLVSADHWVNFCAVMGRMLTRVPTRVAVSQRMHLSRHAKHKPILRRLVSRLYPHAHAIVAVSDGVADDLASTAGVNHQSITTIYNPVVTPELEQHARTPLKHPWFAPGAPPLVLAVGRLTLQKDFASLLRAFARVREMRPARLMILGDGSRRRDLQLLAERLGIVDDVALPGFVANPYAYMARASVFVLSSAWEGFGNVLVEALACGCPVVSTDCPSGPAEILDHGAYGRLVPVGDDAALAMAILATLDAPPDAVRLQARAANFSVERAVDGYLDVLFGHEQAMVPR